MPIYYPKSIQWLTQLAILFPIKHVLLIGASSGACEWLGWLQQQTIPHVTLIETNPGDHPILQTETNIPSDWTIYNQLIAEHTGTTTFYHASLSSESGLIAPEKLTAIWPNIQTTQQQNLAALSLQDFTLKQDLQPELLIINCFGAQSLLQHTTDLLQHTNIIIAKTSLDIENLPEADLTALAEYLHAQNFKLIATESGRHPKVAYAIFVKDHAKLNRITFRKYQSATQQNQAQQTEKKVLEKHLTQLKQELVAIQEKNFKHVKKWKQTAKKYKYKFSELEKKHEQYTHALPTQQRELFDQQQEQLLQYLNTLFRTQTEQTASLLATQIDRLTSKNVVPDYNETIQKTEKNVINTLTQRLNNSTSQIEAYIAIHNYLNTGSLLSGFHGWPISPDIGLFIINQMRQKQYDLVIEFGSGTSTLLFAKLAAAKHHQPLMSDLLPQKILSFDHHADYYQRTQVLLNTNQVAKHVDLVHAPLIEWQKNEQTFLYYDCEATLQQLAQNLQGKSAKILVLVDGPPGDTCKNARYPAVPLLFKYLAEHQIDIILDDATRPEEREVAAKWQNFLSNCQIAFSDEKIINEKGIYFVKTANS
ncbi:class I SAM-dependent methyltransferase [Uruburuella testudinis]|uniref:Class I SAM-dependent methyltransferase n=1 Tax=Uruburuella testudinis TaxID=1282863 RepID=A0ABY4DRT4_9NEIS|nr:class I SAM-dependent methyltransferase [Uruburuella testudinis]UOO81740.1 class I SAM-dependent methyltransferase [Uruburuella testudinis]